MSRNKKINNIKHKNSFYKHIHLLYSCCAVCSVWTNHKFSWLIEHVQASVRASTPGSTFPENHKDLFSIFYLTLPQAWQAKSKRTHVTGQLTNIRTCITDALLAKESRRAKKKVIYWVIHADPWYKNHTDPVHAYITFGFELPVHVVRVERLPYCTIT